MTDVRDNTDAHRFELEIEGQTAVAIYNLSGHNLMITEVSCRRLWKAAASQVA